jgi:hypothetical protein
MVAHGVVGHVRAEHGGRPQLRDQRASRISMTEPGESAFTKPIQVSDFAPYIEVGDSPIPKESLRIARNCESLRSLHFSSGRQDILAVELVLFDRKIFAETVAINGDSNEPLHIPGRKVANVLDSYVCNVRCGEIDTPAIDRDVGALQNSRVGFLPFRGVLSFRPQVPGGNPKQHRRETKDDSEPGDKLMLVSMEESGKLNETKATERNDRATEKGAVILLTIIVGGGLIGWLAKR